MPEKLDSQKPPRPPVRSNNKATAMHSELGIPLLESEELRVLDIGPRVGVDSFRNTLFTETDLKVCFLVEGLRSRGLIGSSFVGEVLLGRDIPTLSVSVSFVPAYLLFMRPCPNMMH